MELKSEKTLRERIAKKIQSLGQSCPGILSGSFYKRQTKVGVSVYESCVVTRKIAGKTKALYIPKTMEAEVEQWVAEYKRVKKTLREIDTLSEALVRMTVPKRQAGQRRKKPLN